MRDTIKMTGHHGTLKSKAIKIMREDFYISKKPNEWLGRGIYFFSERQDAWKWAEQEARKAKHHGEYPFVITADISCSKGEFADLDYEEERHKMDTALQKCKYKGAPEFSSDKEMRCFYSNLYKRLSGIKVMAYTFPIALTNKYGFPYILNKRQISVENNEYLSNKRGKYYEYVV